ncbi:GDSL-type esterase/lipase family protein [Microbulbifer rhizosphaerae]|uniref:Lysophospholipase L1-like esterase n=1 Tax=Microbulbifer rhizosphaerae TaxID=1562603 RepID=A0A7W4ZA75_9GAMM|nr:lysophospholipase L1-like esterase [Microbulbifer rhizosphaerae]
MKAIPVYLLWALASLSECAGASGDASLKTVDASSDNIRWSGRFAVLENGSTRFGYPSVSANLAISRGDLSVTASSSKDGSYMAVTVDDRPPRRFTLTRTPKQYSLVESDGKPHTVRLSHLSEAWRGIVTVEKFTLAQGEFLSPPAAPERKLLVIGDSVTCGEGVHQPADYQCDTSPRQSDSDHSYGMLLGRAMGAETQLVCYGGRGLIRSWNGNTDELQAPQFFELDIPINNGPAADLSAFVPDVILISLGTNDFNLDIGPLPERSEFVSTYVEFVERLLSLYPDAEIALTEGAIVNDAADPAKPQRSVLRSYISDTVKRTADARVHQVLSQHHSGDTCDAHPTGQQHEAMAGELLPAIVPLLTR